MPVARVADTGRNKSKFIFHTKRSTSLVGDLARDQRESLEHSRAQTRGPAYRLCLLALQVSSQNNELIDLPIAQREIAQTDQWFRQTLAIEVPGHFNRQNDAGRACPQFDHRYSGTLVEKIVADPSSDRMVTLVLHELIVDDCVGQKRTNDIRQSAVIDGGNKRVNGGSEFG